MFSNTFGVREGLSWRAVAKKDKICNNAEFTRTPFCASVENLTLLYQNTQTEPTVLLAENNGKVIRCEFYLSGLKLESKILFLQPSCND